MAVALALVTSLSYGLSNFVGPLLTRDLPLYGVLVAGQAVAFGVSGAALAVQGSASPGAGVVLAALGAGLGNAWGLIAVYRAATLGPLSIIMPLGALGTVVPVAVGIAGGDPVGALKLAGIALALGGVVLAARRPGPGDSAGAEAADRRAAVRWALAGALGFGVFLTLVAPASRDGVFWAVLLSRASLLTVLLVVAAALREALRVRPRQLPKLALPGVLLFVGTLSYAAATREGELSTVSVVGSLFPVVTVGLAFALLGERLTRSQAAGVLGALLGVVLLSVR